MKRILLILSVIAYNLCAVEYWNWSEDAARINMLEQEISDLSRNLQTQIASVGKSWSPINKQEIAKIYASLREIYHTRIRALSEEIKQLRMNIKLKKASTCSD